MNKILHRQKSTEILNPGQFSHLDVLSIIKYSRRLEESMNVFSTCSGSLQLKTVGYFSRLHWENIYHSRHYCKNSGKEILGISQLPSFPQVSSVKRNSSQNSRHTKIRQLFFDIIINSFIFPSKNVLLLFISVI